MKPQSLKRWASIIILGVTGIISVTAFADNGKAHDPNHANHADCVRTNALNSTGAVVKRSTSVKIVPQDFYRSAQSVLAKMKYVKPITKAHNPNHEGHAICVQTNAMNTQGPVVKRVNHRAVKNSIIRLDHNFVRQAQAVLNMSKVKRIIGAHNPNHEGHEQCVIVNKLNSSGKAVKAVSK